MKRKWLIRSLCCLAAFLVFVGCTKKESGDTGSATAGSGSSASETSNTVKIALIIENTIDDKGWCQAMHDGIIAAQKDLPGRIEYSYTEKMLPVDAGSAVSQYAAQGYTIIIGHGAQYKNLILETAEEYPNITFAFGTSAEIGPANVFTYMPESEETGYLNGIIAGLASQSGIIGYVGPVDGGDAARYGRGYVLGAQSVKPDIKIMAAHTGSFSDFVKAGEVAQTQISSGADVLTGAAQQAIGALRATNDDKFKDRYLWWVGQDISQIATPEGKAKCLAASSYNYKAVITDMIKKLDSGVKGGECIPMNFHNGGFVFTYNESLAGDVPEEIRSKVTEALDSFTKNANTIANWSGVDYSKL
ncbi:MAG: BMP family protein [Spirochaetaceae bacterium]|jgi:basic membrane protein A|nr:BMP family protein [Spirochaetaceae bacterium]